jgi:hypothetical protein
LNIELPQDRQSRAAIITPASAGRCPNQIKCAIDFSQYPVLSRILNFIRELDDEVVVVRHLHLGQGLRVHRLVLRDQIVGREQVSARPVC